MPILYPDILEHNNSAKALVDITQLRGSSYPVGILSETGSIPTDKRKLGAIIFVSSSQQFYGFYGQTTGSVDWDSTSNWRTLSTFSGSFTGSFTGSLFGTASYSDQALSSSYALTASFALNGGGGGSTNTGSLLTTASVNLNTITFTKGDGSTFPITVNTGSGGGGGSTFPYTGSAGISGSLDLNGPLNVDVQTFNIDNDTFIQNAVFNSSSINLNTISNQVDTLNNGWGGNSIYLPPSSITSGSTFIIQSNSTNYGTTLPAIGTKIFYNGGQSDSYGISGYQWFGIVIGTSSYYEPGPEVDFNVVTASAYITTSSLSQQTYRFYNPGTGSGTINLNGNTNISGSTNINGNTNISGSVVVTNNISSSGNVTAANFYGNGNTLSGIITNPFTGSFLVSGSINVNGPYTGSKLLLTGNELNIGTTNTSSKSINLGRIETGLNQDGTTNRPDQNTITFNRNLNDVHTNIHTRINFNGRYWVYNPGPETYDVLADTNNHYLQFNSSISSSGNIIYNRFIDLQFHTQPTGSNVAKGFSTNYNGSTYFNVTGSVSASSYYGDGSNLTGLIVNPFIGSFITTGSLLVAGSTSINGSLLVTGSLRATGSIIVTGSVNSTEGVNGVFIGEGLGSRTTNLVIGDTRSLSTVSGTGTSGQNLIAIGSGSLISATTTFKNIALGNNVLPTITSNGSNNNIGIGFDVLTLGTTSLTNNIAIGNSASFGTTSGDNNIAIGSEALFSNTSQNNNIGIGLRAGRNATGAANSIFIGTDAAASLTSGDFNIAIGFEAFRFASSNSYNVAIGYQALVSGSGVTNCIAIGANALERATSGDFNVAIGFEALKLATTNSNNIAIGYQSLLNGSGVIDSIAIGANALRNTTTGDDNIGIGANALRDNAAGNGNLAIGTDSMITPSSTLASNNTAIGFQSLQLITGSNNLALGYRTMQSFRSGSNNTVVGYNSIIGAGISGSNNTIIGANVVLPGGVYNNRIIIADGQGNQRVSVSGSITSISGSLNVTGSSAIFTLQPLDPLPTVGIPTGSFAVSSSIPAKPYFWDGSVWNALY